MENFDKIQAKKTFNKIGWFYLLGTALVIAVQYIMIFILRAFSPDVMNDGNAYLLFTYMPLLIIAYPIFIFVVTRMPKAKTIEEHKMSVGQVLVAFIMCYSLMYIGNILGSIINMLGSLIKGSTIDNPLVEVVMDTNPLVQLFVMVIGAPIFEEFIFRKLLIDRVIKYGEGLSILLSAFIFAMFHGNISQGIYAFALGAFLAFIYIRTGRIRYTMTLHMMINFMGSILSGSIMKLIDIQTMTKLMQEDMSAYLNWATENAGVILLVAGYMLCLAIITITGIILWIVFRKKFYLKPTEMSIPKKEGFKVVMCNAGMICFTIIWGGMYVVSFIV